MSPFGRGSNHLSPAGAAASPAGPAGPAGMMSDCGSYASLASNPVMKIPLSFLHPPPHSPRLATLLPHFPSTAPSKLQRFEWLSTPPPTNRCQIGLEFKWSVSPTSGGPANTIPFFKRNAAWLRRWKPRRRRPRIRRRVLNLGVVPRHGGCQSKCVSTPPLEQFGPRVPVQIDKQLIGGAGAADPPAASSTRRSQNSIFRESAGEGLSCWKRAWLMHRQHFGGSLLCRVA